MAMRPDKERCPGTGTEAARKPDEAEPSLPDHVPSPSCDAAACVLANLATSDLLARYRVSAASRDVSEHMVSTGLLDKVTAAIGQPVSPEDWIRFYRRRAAELDAKLEPRRRELRAGVGS